MNEQLRIAHLNYYRTFGSGTADTFYTWHTGAIPSQYRPGLQCNGAINHLGTISVDADGNIGGKFVNSFSSSKSVSGTVIWTY